MSDQAARVVDAIFDLLLQCDVGRNVLQPNRVPASLRTTLRNAHASAIEGQTATGFIAHLRGQPT